LILRNDKSVVPALRSIAAGQSNEYIKTSTPLARLHAIWTLEGLDALEKAIVLKALKDPDAQIRKAAVILCEPYLKAQNKTILAQLSELKVDMSPDVRMQLVLSLSYSKSPDAKKLADEVISGSTGNEVVASAQKSIDKNEEVKKFGLRLGRLEAGDRKLVMDGAIIYKSLCTTCHGPDGKGIVSKTAPPLVGSKRLNRTSDASVRILLHGLSGPVDGQAYPTEMPSMKDNDDEWISSVASYIRHEFSNAPAIRPSVVKMIREETAAREKAFTLEELVPKQ
jgi:mono/diheme cytochrome c family protein